MARVPYVRVLAAGVMFLGMVVVASLLAGGRGRRRPAGRPGRVAATGGWAAASAFRGLRGHFREILVGSAVVLAPVAVVILSALAGGDTPAGAFPSKQQDCSNCHGTAGVYPNQVTAVPGSTSLAPGAAYTVDITMSPPVNGATGTGYWIANSDAAGATGATTSVYAGGSGQGTTGVWQANMTAPMMPGTYYYKVFGNSGPADPSGLPGYALYSITVQGASTPTATATSVAPTNTAVPPTATSVPTSTPVPATATATRTATPTVTATAVPPTSTTVPPTATATATSVPPTSTPLPPTSTAVPPTATSVPPMATGIPPTATTVHATSTAVAATATATVAAATSTPAATATPSGTAPTATPTAQCGDDDHEGHGEQQRRRDIDGDGRVTGRDVLIVFRGAYLARLGLLRTDQVTLLDVDSDGQVTFRDALLVLRQAFEEDDCED